MNTKKSINAKYKATLEQVNKAIDDKKEVVGLKDIKTYMKNMNYLPMLDLPLENQKESNKAFSFLNAMWTFLNPYDKDKVQKQYFIDFVALIITNITVQEAELYNKVADELLRLYAQQGIYLINQQNVDNSVDNKSQHMIGQSFDAIQEEDETKAMKIF